MLDGTLLYLPGILTTQKGKESLEEANLKLSIHNFM